jgi:hypothetical protein
MAEQAQPGQSRHPTPEERRDYDALRRYAAASDRVAVATGL